MNSVLDRVLSEVHFCVCAPSVHSEKRTDTSICLLFFYFQMLTLALNYRYNLVSLKWKNETLHHDNSMRTHLSPRILKPDWQNDIASQCPVAFMPAKHTVYNTPLGDIFSESFH